MPLSSGIRKVRTSNKQTYDIYIIFCQVEGNDYLCKKNSIEMTKPHKIKHRKKKKSPQKPKMDVNEFIYGEDLVGCEGCIEARFFPPTGPLFRWVDNPSGDHNFVPQYYMKKEEDDDLLEMERTPEERVSDACLSMYTSEKAAIIKYKSITLALEKRDIFENNPEHEGHKASFIGKVGDHVIKVNLTEKEGLVSEANKDGHVDVLLKKAFDRKTCTDQDFGHHKIK